MGLLEDGGNGFLDIWCHGCLDVSPPKLLGHPAFSRAPRKNPQSIKNILEFYMKTTNNLSYEWRDIATVLFLYVVNTHNHDFNQEGGITQMLRFFIVGDIIEICFERVENLSREARGPQWLFSFSLSKTYKNDLHQEEKLHESRLSVDISHWWRHSWTLIWKNQKCFTWSEGFVVSVNLFYVMTIHKPYFI